MKTGGGNTLPEATKRKFPRMDTPFSAPVPDTVLIIPGCLFSNYAPNSMKVRDHDPSLLYPLYPAQGLAQRRK